MVHLVELRVKHKNLQAIRGVNRVVNLAKLVFTVIRLDTSNLTTERKNMMVITKTKVVLIVIKVANLIAVIVTIVILSIIQVYSLVKFMGSTNRR